MRRIADSVLLLEARSLLLDRLVPHIPPQHRYQALLVARTLEVAAAEVGWCKSSVRDLREQVMTATRIRMGDCDANALTYVWLSAQVEAGLSRTIAGRRQGLEKS